MNSSNLFLLCSFLCFSILCKCSGFSTNINFSLRSILFLNKKVSCEVFICCFTTSLYSAGFSRYPYELYDRFLDLYCSEKLAWIELCFYLGAKSNFLRWFYNLVEFTEWLWILKFYKSNLPSTFFLLTTKLW